MGFNPMLRELTNTPFTLRDGQVEIPDQPGLGVNIDQAFIARYTTMVE
jgi:L-alanine-DL-glutamate epimerase-like enolase superfamily enzyme